MNAQPLWNLAQVAAWIIRRDLAFVDESRDRDDIVALVTGKGRSIQEAEFAHVCRGGEKAEIVQARELLRKALLTGELIALGLANNTGDRTTVPQEQWEDLRFQDDGAAPPRARRGATLWHGLKFESQAVMELWPDPLASTELKRETLVVDEKACCEWLIGEMRKGRSHQTKSAYQAEALS